MTQVARNLTAAGDDFLHGMQQIILDRDPLYTATFRRLLRDGGVTPLVLPKWTPNLNADADGLSSPSSPSAWTAWCCSVKAIAGRSSESLSTTIMKNGRIKAWLTSSSRQ
jgi:hypothetical protein